MNFLNLEYFIVTAEEMNFTKAAKRLYISQPSLSNHIAKLEEYFGVMLFDRNPPLTLTDAGESLLRHAREIMNIKEETVLELQDIKDFKNATLTIGVTHIRGSYILPPLLMKFKKEFPNVRIKLVEGNTDEITEELYNGKVDLTLGFRADFVAPGKIQSEIIQEDPVLIAVPENILQEFFTEEEQRTLLASDKQPIQVFSKCPFIKMSAPSWIAKLFEQSCNASGMTPNVAIETQNITTLVSLCTAGYGVIICPSIFLRETGFYLRAADREILHTFILDYPTATKTIAANYLKNKYQTKVARRFIKMAKQEVNRP